MVSSDYVNLFGFFLYFSTAYGANSIPSGEGIFGQCMNGSQPRILGNLGN